MRKTPKNPKQQPKPKFKAEKLKKNKIAISDYVIVLEMIQKIGNAGKAFAFHYNKTRSLALIEEYFKFKKQSFDFENLRVRSMKSIRNLDLMLTVAIGYVAELSGESYDIKLRAEIIENSNVYSETLILSITL